MKLDKIKFARLVAMITSEYKFMHNDFVHALDDFLDIYVPEPVAEQIYPKNENVERLMMLMVEGTRKIDAIREHRAITGMGLKESKDAVERYWPVGGQKVAGFTKGELMSKLNANAPEAQSDFYVIVDFINNL